MLLKKTLCIVIMAAGLTGCINMGPKQSAGQLIGAATGAVVGAQFGKGSGRLVGVALGTLAGTYIGGSIGQQLDAQDRAMAQSAMRTTLENAPDNQVRSWRNPNNNHCGQYQVTRTQEYPTDNQVCRDYVHIVTIDGRQERVHGRACRDVRDPRATWMVQS